MTGFPRPILRARCLSISLVILSGVLPGSISAQTVAFTGSRDFPVGMTPFSVAVADFNGDGKPDVVTANTSSNDLSVLLGNGDGTLQPAVSYPVGTGPITVRTGDVSGDGIPDLAVLSASVSVLLGNGDGTFGSPRITAISAGNLPTDLVVADFNNDGEDDIALPLSLPQAGTYAVALLLSNGDGSFKPAVTYPIGGNGTNIAAADFDGDGKLDLITANNVPGANTYSILLGNGDGTFKTAITSASNTCPGPIAVADFNLDGKLDFVVGSVCGSNLEGAQLFLGKGDGTFAAPMAISAGSVLASGDFNDDGKPDLLLSSSPGSGTTLIMLGNGDGTFTQATTFYGPGIYAISDLNLDGNADAVIANTGVGGFGGINGIVSTLIGNGNGTFQTAPAITTTDESLGSHFTADFNNDGRPDVGAVYLFESAPSKLEVWLNTGNGTFAVPQVSPLSNQFLFPAVGDFNHDGNADVAIGYSQAAVLLGIGNGTFQPEVDYNAGGADRSMLVADFNGDGNLDLAQLGSISYCTATCSGGISVMLGKGDGTFGPYTVFPVGIGPSSATTGDFNHDGMPDLAVTNSLSGGPGVSVLLGNGDGTFQPLVQYPFGITPTGIATADFNGDGNLDLAVSDEYSGTVQLLLGNADGTFGSPTRVNIDGGAPSDIIAGDLNHDGKIDLAVLNLAWNDVSVILGNGDGTFQPAVLFGASAQLASAWSLMVADFDDDGGADLAVGTGNGFVVLYNRPANPTLLLSSGQVSFANQALNTPSLPLAVSITNTGRSSLILDAINFTGPQAAAFSQTNDCGSNLAGSSSCTIDITFTPTSLGSFTAALSITDNASGSPHTATLTGIGGSIGLSIASGSAGSATVTAGEPASYNLTIGGAGLAGVAVFVCTGAPQGVNCSVPASQSVSATIPSTLGVDVATTARTMSSLAPVPGTTFLYLCAIPLLGLVFVPATLVRKRSPSPTGRALLRLAMLLPFLLLASCGGGSNSGGSSIPATPSGTPSGTYTLTVTAFLGSVSQAVPLTLVVK
jgi:FG-GAP-like repeat/Abnormal spindle-like microcephaly-assoc'd, ASPM-SPD-2-Hydin